MKLCIMKQVSLEAWCKVALGDAWQVCVWSWQSVFSRERNMCSWQAFLHILRNHTPVIQGSHSESIRSKTQQKQDQNHIPSIRSINFSLLQLISQFLWKCLLKCSIANLFCKFYTIYLYFIHLIYHYKIIFFIMCYDFIYIYIIYIYFNMNHDLWTIIY